MPDLLVIYLFYFGGSLAVTRLFRTLGHDTFVGVPPFLAGAVVTGLVELLRQSQIAAGPPANRSNSV